MAYLLVLAVLSAWAAIALRGDEPTAKFVPGDPAPQHLTAAAVNLLGSPGERYRGWFADPDGDRITVDARITNEGSTLATLTVAGEKVTLAATGSRAFLRAGATFWRAHGAPAESIAEYGKQWVKVPPDFLGVDVATLLAPGALARALGVEAEQGRTSSGRTTTLNGVEVRAIRTSAMTVYVTTAQPRQVVRIAADPQASPRPEPSTHHTSWWPDDRPRLVPAGAPTGTEYEIDLSHLTDQEVDDLYRRLAEKIRELKTSIDSQVRFALDGSVTLSPCTTGGCRANVTISNSVDSRSPYLKAKQPVHAAITIRMTLDGRPVATCRKTKTMRPNGSASVSCFAAYYIPPSRNPRTHTVRAMVSAVARAVVTADIKKLVTDLAAEQKRNRPNRDPATAPTTNPRPPKPGAPTPGPSHEDECDVDPFLDPQGEDHVRERHFMGGRRHDPDNDGTWYDDVDLYELAEDAADVPAVPQANGRCSRVADAGRPIGTNRQGQITSRYQVIHLKNGRVWTMYPV